MRDIMLKMEFLCVFVEEKKSTNHVPDSQFHVVPQMVSKTSVKNV